jgi:hypothetical protein
LFSNETVLFRSSFCSKNAWHVNHFMSPNFYCYGSFIWDLGRKIVVDLTKASAKEASHRWKYSGTGAIDGWTIDCCLRSYAAFGTCMITSEYQTLLYIIYCFLRALGLPYHTLLFTFCYVPWIHPVLNWLFIWLHNILDLCIEISNKKILDSTVEATSKSSTWDF